MAFHHHHHHQLQQQTELAGIQHLDRKTKKPLMEKRRRARINKCLVELKSLLLEALKRDPSQTSKLEKADILEMTVHLIRSMYRQQMAFAATIDATVLDKYQAGWAECAMQVTHYVNSVQGFNPQVKLRLLKHLDFCFRSIAATKEQQITAAATNGFLSSPPEPVPPGLGMPPPQLPPGFFPPNLPSGVSPQQFQQQLRHCFPQQFSGAMMMAAIANPNPHLTQQNLELMTAMASQRKCVPPPLNISGNANVPQCRTSKSANAAVVPLKTELLSPSGSSSTHSAASEPAARAASCCLMRPDSPVSSAYVSSNGSVEPVTPLSASSASAAFMWRPW